MYNIFNEPIQEQISKWLLYNLPFCPSDFKRKLYENKEMTDAELVEFLKNLKDFIISSESIPTSDCFLMISQLKIFLLKLGED